MAHENIKQRILEHRHHLHNCTTPQQQEQEELALLEFILLEIAAAEGLAHRSLNRLAQEILGQIKQVKQNQAKIMIDQNIIDASIKRAETDVHNLIAALPGNQTPSTPDTVVTSLLGRVDGLSTAAEAALATVGTPPPPPTP